MNLSSGRMAMAAAADTTAPTVSITSPAGGTTVTSTIQVQASAADDVAVTRVELYLDGSLVDWFSMAPYTFYFQSWRYPTGPHVMTVKAFDAAGNVGTSAPLSITVERDTTPPVTSIASPSQGATVAGVVSIQANVSDDHDVSSVDFLVDGVRFMTSRAAPHVVTWDSHTVANGPHTLTTRAYDGAYNSATSAPVSILVAQPGGAQYDPVLRVPACPSVSNVCDSTSLLQGRGFVGPELHAPNTLDGCADGTNTDESNHTEQIHWLRVSRADGRPFVAGRRVQVDIAVEVPAYSQMAINLYTASDATAPVWTHLTTLNIDPLLYADQRGFHVYSAEYVLPEGSLQAVRANFWKGSPLPSPCSTDSIDDRDDLVFAVGQEVDQTPPTVSMTSPANNAFAGGTVTVKAAADDDFNVTQVEFYDGSTRIGLDAAKPFSMDWYIGNLGESTHTLTAKAYDAAGHVTTSAPVTVLIDNSKPLAWFSSPMPDALVRGTVQVTAGASDAHGIKRVDFYTGQGIFASLIGSATSAPYTLSWNTLTEYEGRHVLHAMAYDPAGNAAQSEVIGVTVDNVPPAVAITSPANGGKVFLSATLQATASDTNGVAQVAFYDGTKLIGTDTTAPYSVNWSTLLVPKGQHTLTARATDGVGNVSSSPGIVVTVQ
ncbi:fibronectin type III domain protein [Stigmatella aurantiaca DW4/3-1]|uniref:Fibronectin type III domain protein n=1 Tax=Stigmatella aurantiaca (strain DW4/3-1) TaxID=378806 RepID=Q08WI7_STIAD|nr:fibronectin type III domain protein [Stigmatella aurantiaca DW4/3-1]